MPVVTREFQFDSGHRVLGHQGKCRHLHGHRYVAQVTVAAAELDSLGMVIDFSMIKDKIGKWIDTNWDHNMILNAKDPVVEKITDWMEIGGRDPYLMPEGKNTTAEEMAEVLFNVAKGLLDCASGKIRVKHVRLYETPNCWADYGSTDQVGPWTFDYKGLERKVLDQIKDNEEKGDLVGADLVESIETAVKQTQSEPEDCPPQSESTSPLYYVANEPTLINFMKTGKHRDWQIVPIGMPKTMQGYANEVELLTRGLEVEQEVIPHYGDKVFFVWLWERQGNRKEDSIPDEYKLIRELGENNQLRLLLDKTNKSFHQRQAGG